MKFQIRDNLAGLMLVLGLHASALYALWSHQLLPDAQEAQALFVSFIAPPAAVKQEVPRKPPPPAARPRPFEPAPVPTPQIVAQSPIQSAQDYVAPAPPPAPTPPPVAIIETVRTVAPPAPAPASALALSDELAVICANRPPPGYPNLSRRLSESGTVLVQVELNEQGLVSSARVLASSGYPRLDEAAVNAVRNWQCTPPRRNGQSVRSVAQQPFRFFLQ